MYLTKPLWSNGISPENGSTEPESESSETALGDLVSSLTEKRLYMEARLALRSGLRDARTEFSFLRVRGLKRLLKFLRSVAESDSSIRFFSQSQSVPELQVVPVLFQHSFREPDNGIVRNLDHIFGVEPMKITSLSTDAEVSLALRVLEGCCLLHKQSTLFAHQHKAIQVLMHILTTRGVLEQGACLDALISIMVDSSANQMDFKACHGLEDVAVLIRNKQMDENLRLKCGEFLLLLIGHVNGRERASLETIHDEIRRLLSEKSASIWAASQFGSTLDLDQRLTALQIQARRVLESLDLY